MDYELLNITSMNGDCTKYAYYLNIVKITKKSIYAKSPVYGWIYRIELKTGKVFLDDGEEKEQIAESCTYEML